jgi:surface antigen
VVVVAGLMSGVLAAVGMMVPTSPPGHRVEPVRHHMRAVERRLCRGYSSCRSHGYSDAGYGQHRHESFWQMYAGANCTNFVAYRLVRAGLPDHRPPTRSGRHARHLDAYRWGLVYASITDHHPAPGSIAWWPHRGRHGHVAWVEAVNDDGSLAVSEDSSSGNGFDWRRITHGPSWPTGFIHFLTHPLDDRDVTGAHRRTDRGGTPRIDDETGWLTLTGGSGDVPDLHGPPRHGDPGSPETGTVGS